MLISRENKTLIGMIHLPALPGSPGFGGDIESLCAHAVADAKAIADGGFDAIMMENFGDTPFYLDQVPAITIAVMTRVACEVRRHISLPLGINVLRNDVTSALAIAKATDAAFVRVNILSGARLTDQGVITGKAHEVLRSRDAWDCTAQILADVAVKHSAPLAPYDLMQEAKDLAQRAGADCLIVSGSGTGQGVDISELNTVREATDKPVFIGSGVTVDNVKSLLSIADGAIIGSSLKDKWQDPIQKSRVETLKKALS